MGAEQSGISSVTVEDMSGGLNFGKFTSGMESRDSTSCQNVYYYDGRLRKMFGESRINTTISGSQNTADVTGIYDYQKRDGTRFKVVTLVNDIVRRNGYGWTSILGSHVITSVKHKFASFNNFIIGTNRNDNTWVWDGLTTNVTDISAAPRGKWVTSFNGVLCIGNVIIGSDSFKTRIYFSNFNDHLTWDLVNNFWEFETSDAQEITGILQLGSKLVVYKEDSIGIVSGYGFSSWTVDRSFRKGIGCVSGYTVAPARIFINNTMREVHIFLGKDGIYAFDGSEVIRLSDKIKEYFKQQNQALFNQAVGAYYGSREQYYVFFPGLASTLNNRGLIYDTRKGGFWPLTPFNVDACSTVRDDTSNLEQLWMGDYNATIRRLNESVNSVETQTELFTNGNMELDANWTSFGGPGTNERSGAQFFNGTFSRHAITTAVNQGFYQDITTVVNNRYRITSAIRVAIGDCYCRKTDIAGTNIVRAQRVAILNTWLLVTLEFTATATTSRIEFLSDGTAVSEFFVDDASARNADIDGQWDSIWLDLGSPEDMKFFREIAVASTQEGAWNIDVRIRYDFDTADGTLSSISLLPTGAAYGTDVYGTGTYGGTTAQYLDAAGINKDAFRYVQIRFRNQYGGQPFNIEKFTMNIKNIGRRFVNNAA